MLSCQNCYFKRDLSGDAHVACANKTCNVHNVNQHGVKNGWFAFPLNFDPIWADSCNGFAPKGFDETDAGLLAWFLITKENTKNQRRGLTMDVNPVFFQEVKKKLEGAPPLPADVKEDITNLLKTAIF